MLPISIIFFLIYFLFLAQLWRGVKNMPAGSEANVLPVSIIVVVRNEEPVIENCLTSLVEQNYPESLLEIIIVDDGSNDRTPELLAKFGDKFPALQIVMTEKKSTYCGNKKIALDQGIHLSTGEILLFTDADCAPPPNWALEMALCFTPEVGLAAGFSPVIGKQNNVWQRIIQLDSLSAGIVAAGAIGLGSAATCTGRNLAFRRSVFDEVNGYQKILGSVSGDDDLFLQLVQRTTSWKIRYNLNPASFVPSFFSKNISKIFVQKKRHLSAGKFYNPRIQLLYFIFHLANFSLFAFFILSFILESFFPVAALLLLGKILLDWRLFKNLRSKFKQPVNLLTLLGWEFYFVFYNSLIAPLSWIGRIKWK